jgi:hypothetical protein
MYLDGASSLLWTMGMVGKVVRGAVVAAVIAMVVGFVLNQTLGPGWYRDLPGGNGVEVGDAKTGEAACRQPSAQLTGKLPTFPGSQYVTTTNPCLGFVDVLAKIDEYVPDPDAAVPNSEISSQGTDARAVERARVKAGRAKFHRGLAAVSRKANVLMKGKDAVQCAYATDNLAVAIYQERKHKWSVGLAAVVRSDADALTETAVCTLLRQIPGLTDADSDEQARPRLSFCFHGKRDGAYTYLWIGSTDLVCGLFSAQWGDGADADHERGGTRDPIVWADPLKLRATPGTEQDAIGSVPFGTAVTPICQIEGEPVPSGYYGQPDKVWIKTEYAGQQGYLARAWLTNRTRETLEDFDDCATVNPG